MEFYVEFNFKQTKWGLKPMEMRFFPTEQEAVEFVRTQTTDGKLGWMKEV